MPQIYEGLVRRSEAVPQLFQQGYERGRDEYRAKSLGELMSAGDLEGARDFAYGEGMLDAGQSIEAQMARSAAAQQEQAEARQNMLRDATTQFAPALGRAAEIEDDAQRGEAIGMIVATASMQYPDLQDDFEEFGAQVYGLPRDQVATIANTLAGEVQGGDFDGERVVAMNPETGQREYAFVSPGGEVRYTGVQAPEPGSAATVNINPEGAGAPNVLTREQVEEYGLDPSQAYEFRRDAQRNTRIVPIGRSAQVAADEAAQEAEAAERQASARREAVAGVARDTSNLLEDVNLVLEQTDEDVTGFMGWLLGNVPGTPAFEYSAQLEAIKGRIALETLDQMRAEAAAQGNRGSGLGQVTEREIRILQATRGALEQAQSASEVRRVLSRLSEQLQTVENSRAIVLANEDIGLARSLYGRDIGTQSNPLRPATQEDYDLIPADSYYIDPDDPDGLYIKPREE